MGLEVAVVANRFIAPCCWRESLATHNSPEADRLRKQILNLIEDGRTEQQITGMLVNTYGTRILREPPGVRGQWLYAMPVVISAMGGLALWRYLRTREKTTPASPSGPLPDFDEGELL